MNIQTNKLNVVIDGQWGSTGKGKLFGYLYSKFPEINIAVCDFMPNAGHTYVDNDGKSFVSKILPVGALFDTVQYILIGPHAVFDIDRLMMEIEEVVKFTGNHTIYNRLRIHPLACVVHKDDKKAEFASLNGIASTMQGSAEAVMRKIKRDPAHANLAKNYNVLQPFLADTYYLMNKLLDDGYGTALAETAQGFDLGLNNGVVWPYVTSRDCMVGRILDNAGVSPKKLGNVLASIRTFPIRVGNTEGGFSGPCYQDQEELTWGEVSERCGSKVCEYTTVTKRVRRIFTWSNEQVERFCKMCGPDYAFLNFVNYLSEGEKPHVIKAIADFLQQQGCKLTLLGTGPKNNDVEEYVA